MIKLALSVTGIYAAIVALMFAFQHRLVYQPGMPGRTLIATPEARGLPFEDVHLTTDDGVRLHGWYVPAEGARRTLLFFHGNAGNISHRLDSLIDFHALGVNVLMLDYRGYGRSEGAPTERGTYEDALTAWRHLVEERGTPPGQIVLHGRSLGGAVAAWLASRRPAGGLILESSFRSLPELAAELYPWLPARRLARLDYDTEARLAEVAVPVLIIHARADEIVPFEHGRALYAAAPEPSTFLALEGDHNSGYRLSSDAYLAGLEAFLESLDAGAVTTHSNAAAGQMQRHRQTP